MMVRVLSDQSVNIDPLVRVLYLGPRFVNRHQLIQLDAIVI